jgi:hypothetical protein
MTYDKWQDIVNKVKTGFKVINQGKEGLDGVPGIKEFVEFSGPLGEMRLELVQKPVILDKKTHYSNRIGSQSAVEYVYDDKEKTLTFKVFKKNGENWEELKGVDLGF